MDFDDSILPESWRPDTCPHCGGLRTAIWYGLPKVEAWTKYQHAVHAGRLQLGGCVLNSPFDAVRTCETCKHGVNELDMPVHFDDSQEAHFKWVPDSDADRAIWDGHRAERLRMQALCRKEGQEHYARLLQERNAKRRRTWRYVRGTSLLISAVPAALAGVFLSNMRWWGARVGRVPEFLLGLGVLLVVVALTRLANRRAWVAGTGLGLAGCASYGIYAVLQVMAEAPSPANRPAYADPEAWAELVARSSPWEQVPGWALWVEGIWLATLMLTAYQLWAGWVGERTDP